jgi:hypothetical protein
VFFRGGGIEGGFRRAEVDKTARGPGVVGLTDEVASASRTGVLIGTPGNTTAPAASES